MLKGEVIKMKYQFAVAVQYHCMGADPDRITKERFDDYDSANAFADKYREECEPTIYIIIDEKYIFYCKRSAVANKVSYVYSLQNTGWGQIKTTIWWEHLVENPKNFYYLAVDKLNKV
jgi:hypothetical protein